MTINRNFNFNFNIGRNMPPVQAVYAAPTPWKPAPIDINPFPPNPWIPSPEPPVQAVYAAPTPWQPFPFPPAPWEPSPPVQAIYAAPTPWQPEPMPWDFFAFQDFPSFENPGFQDQPFNQFPNMFEPPGQWMT